MKKVIGSFQVQSKEAVDDLYVIVEFSSSNIWALFNYSNSITSNISSSDNTNGVKVEDPCEVIFRTYNAGHIYIGSGDYTLTYIDGDTLSEVNPDDVDFEGQDLVFNFYYLDGSAAQITEISGGDSYCHIDNNKVSVKLTSDNNAVAQHRYYVTKGSKNTLVAINV